VSEVELYQDQQVVDVIDRVRDLLAQAETVEDVRDLRDQAEMVRVWATRRDGWRAVELDTQDLIRRAERKMAELVIELKEAGKVRKGGRPKKAVSDSQVPDEEPVSDSQVSARELFGDATAQRAAYLFAAVNEDEWNEALGTARENGDVSRRAILRILGNQPAHRGDNGDITPIAQVMAAVFRNLAAVVERLQEFDPATIEHPRTACIP